MSEVVATDRKTRNLCGLREGEISEVGEGGEGGGGGGAELSRKGL